MIPDKIYITREEISECENKETHTIFCGNTQLEDTDIEYIRKDALLEWAEAMHDVYDEKYNDSGHTCGEHWGQRNAFKQVIDKINSL